jgi:hypothetical protein
MSESERTLMLADQQDALLVSVARERGMSPEALAAELLQRQLINMARYRRNIGGDSAVIGGLFGPQADNEVVDE